MVLFTGGSGGIWAGGRAAQVPVYCSWRTPAAESDLPEEQRSGLQGVVAHSVPIPPTTPGKQEE